MAPRGPAKLVGVGAAKRTNNCGGLMTRILLLGYDPETVVIGAGVRLPPRGLALFEAGVQQNQVGVRSFARS